MTWPEPRGGFFIWATLPPTVDAEQLLARATRHRVIFVVGGAFFLDGSGRNLLRLSFSQPPPERIDEGVRRLAEAVREEIGEQLQRSAPEGGAVSSNSGVSAGSAVGAAAGSTGTGGSSSGTDAPRG
jgi:hypothetical protein